MKKLTLILMVVAFFPVRIVFAHEPDLRPEVRTIDVTGTATLEYPPDLMIVRIGVTLNNNDPVDLQQTLTATGVRMLTFVEESGIDAQDVSTDQISLTAVNGDDNPEDCPERPLSPTYEGETAITITLKDFGAFDRLVAGLFKNGANRLISVSFDSTLRAEKTKEARIEAVKAAKNKATYIAKELGQFVGNPLKINVGERSYSPLSITSNSYLVSDRSPARLSASSVSTENLTATAQVTIVFALEEQSPLSSSTE